MAESTLVQVYGANATQDLATVTQSKTDLATVGLVPSATNAAETIFVSQLLLAKTRFNETNRDADPSISITISDPSESIQTLSGVRYKVRSFTIELYKQEDLASTNPMDYA